MLRPLEGASVHETVRELVAGDASLRAQISGVGSVDGVRLVREDAPRAGVVELVSLVGAVSADGARWSLFGRDGAGAWVGGELTDARVVDLELTVEVLEREPERPAPSAKPSWADVAAASTPRAPAIEDDGPEAPVPHPGDVVEHPSFGACTVEKVEDEEFIHVRSPQRRLLRLSLEVLRLELVSDPGASPRHYRVRAGRAR